MTTPEQIRELIQADFDKEQRRIIIHDEIAALLLAKFNGKKITERLINYLKEKFPGWTIVLDNVASSHSNIHIWGGDSGFKYDDHISFMLGYSNELKSYNPTVFEERDARHGSAARARQEKRTAMLNSASRLVEIAVSINKYNATLQELNALKETALADDCSYIFRDLFNDK